MGVTRDISRPSECYLTIFLADPTCHKASTQPSPLPLPCAPCPYPDLPSLGFAPPHSLPALYPLSTCAHTLRPRCRTRSSLTRQRPRTHAHNYRADGYPILPDCLRGSVGDGICADGHKRRSHIRRYGATGQPMLAVAVPMLAVSRRAPTPANPPILRLAHPLAEEHLAEPRPIGRREGPDSSGDCTERVGLCFLPTVGRFACLGPRGAIVCVFGLAGTSSGTSGRRR